MRRASSLEKILMLGKIEGKRWRGQYRIRWLGGIINSMDMSLSRLWEIVEDRGDWRATVHGVASHFTSVAQSWPTLCDPMDCSTPGFPVHHQLLELVQTQVHQVGDGISSSVIPFSSCLQSFPAWGSFQMSQFFTSDSQSIGASASASVLPMNIQDWFPLALMGLISLQSRGLSRLFSNTTVQSIGSLMLSFLYSPTLTSILDYWKNHSFTPFLPRSKCLNFMAAVTICSDFGAQDNKVCHCFHCFPIYLPWSDGTRCHDLGFLNVGF